MQYIKVILPLKLAWEPYYSCTEPGVGVGSRVEVTFARKSYVGVVSEVCSTTDVDASKILPVKGMATGLDDITPQEMELWRFVASYYLCSVGEVYKAAYPEGRTKSEKIAAGVKERAEQSHARKLASLDARIERLTERLRRKDADLEGKHSENVESRLRAERQRIGDELSLAVKARERICDEGKGPDQAGELPQCSISPALKGALNSHGTLLIQGENRMESYIALASKTMSEGRDVLYMVPEIVLTERLVDTLEDAFPGRVLAFHSHETVARRREVASRLRRKGPGRLILGTRSALFLPFAQLGLVIVDEEHDVSYKQDSPAPRYNSRDLATMMGRIHKCSVVMGSSTPSLESIYNCASKRYAFIQLPQEEHREDMLLIGTSAEKRKNGMVGSLSRKLIARLQEELATGGKPIILRTWGPVDELAREVEEALGTKLDCFTTYAARNMDLGGYSLVAVVQADYLLRKDDFRADERALQMLEQFRARSGGKRLIIQAQQIEHPVFEQLGRAYDGMALLEERKEFALPPFTRLLDITVRDSNVPRMEKLSRELAACLPMPALGPFPVEEHRGDETISSMRIRITLPKDRQLASSKASLAEAVSSFEKSARYTGHITIDVDPN